ncbi:hypothetical protein HPP92_014109 [Vanilla planifolia]|uniref:Cysteine-rich receptor-like protein kinase 10 n=1 Tax=Vanilla planifolia TaxID=51239 RepID=A0A835QSX8_VANPL|nr:hypothetical protein HPP92_014109 [Vanilla planifolia]
MARPSRHLPLPVFLLFTLPAYAIDGPFLTACSVDKFSSPSKYNSNLHLLLSNLTGSVPTSPNFFSTASIGSPPASQLFGLAQCRPDATAGSCTECLSLASSTAPVNESGGCGYSNSAALRYESCYLRYSNQKFFGIVDRSLAVFAHNVENSSNPVVFEDELQRLMADILPKASTSESRFAVGKRMIEEVQQTIYGLAWCSMDVIINDCLNCLSSVQDWLLTWKIGGQAAYSSCYIRFEINAFFPLDMISVTTGAPQTVPNVSTSHNETAGGGGIATSNDDTRNRSSNKVILIIAISGAALLIIIFVIIMCMFVRRKILPLSIVRTRHGEDNEDLSVNADSFLFSLVTLRNATNDFSEENKLGKGGFGPVYKGLLSTGQQIAVKRLSGTSRQGLIEMKNEVLFVAKLQHRNLARLLGYCLEDNEKLLVYEYLSNTSLDKFLFDPIKKSLLDWETRFKIIEGIGRGLLYLHEDSRLRIIHRDLKPSNILLDNDMNPKISDFGLAKLITVDETQKNTSRIAGTYGYMAPEYALHGMFSTNSDVFSYGVLILEIVTGRSNSVQVSDQARNLLSLVWRYWKQGWVDRIVDDSLCGQYSSQQVMKCVHIALLCVQDNQGMRPSMASLIIMLSSSSIMLPTPTTPAFYDGQSISCDANI